MSQGPPEDFLPVARELVDAIWARERADPAFVAERDQSIALTNERVLRAMDERPSDPWHMVAIEPVAWAAGVLALEEAMAAMVGRGASWCSHLDNAFDGRRGDVDLTCGWVTCGCDEKRSPLQENNACDLCDRPAPEYRRLTLALTGGAVYTGDFCARCAWWFERTDRRSG